MLKSSVLKPDTFLYFSYGSNMFSYWIHLNNCAEFVSIGRLDNYRLDFMRYSKFWGGPVATIVPTANGQVWGVVWRLHNDDIEKLDEQQGVDRKIYYFKQVNILTPYIGDVTCRVYIQRINPLPRVDNDEIPVERWPSWTYKEILIIGALEHKLPDHYIAYLENIKDNGERGYFRTDCLLTRYAKDPPCQCKVTRHLPRGYKLDLKNLKRKIHFKLKSQGKTTNVS